jgi:hypothetical protein
LWEQSKIRVNPMRDAVKLVGPALVLGLVAIVFVFHTIRDYRLRGSSGARTDISRNDITNVGVGIQFSQEAHGTLSGSTVTGVTNTGIRLFDADTSAIVTGISVRGARLGIEGRARTITIADYIIEDSRQFGIQLGPNAVVEVSGNTITVPADPEPDRDSPYGIRIFAGVSGRIADNQVAKHGNPESEHTACGSNACDNLAIDTDPPPTYRMHLGGSPLEIGVSQQGIRCESGAAPQR